MDENELRRILGDIQAAEIIWAEVRGGKLDGKFVPIWLSDIIATQLGGAGTGTVIAARTYVFRVEETAIAEIMRQNVLRVKGASAAWPSDIEIERGYAGGYVTRRRAS